MLCFMAMYDEKERKLSKEGVRSGCRPKAAIYVKLERVDPHICFEAFVNIMSRKSADNLPYVPFFCFGGVRDVAFFYI